MYALAVFDIVTRSNMAQVPKLDSQVISGYFVHLDLALIHVIRTENNKDCVFALLAPMSKKLTDIRRDTA